MTFEVGDLVECVQPQPNSDLTYGLYTVIEIDGSADYGYLNLNRITGEKISGGWRQNRFVKVENNKEAKMKVSEEAYTSNDVSVGDRVVAADAPGISEVWIGKPGTITDIDFDGDIWIEFDEVYVPDDSGNGTTKNWSVRSVRKILDESAEEVTSENVEEESPKTDESQELLEYKKLVAEKIREIEAERGWDATDTVKELGLEGLVVKKRYKVTRTVIIESFSDITDDLFWLDSDHDYDLEYNRVSDTGTVVEEVK